MIKYFKSSGLLILFFLLFFLSSAQKITVIKGKIQHNTFSNVDLKLAYGNDVKPISSAIINPDGTFTVTANIPQQDLYRLVFTDKDAFLCSLSPGDNINIELDAQSLNNIIAVSGSKSMTFVKEVSDLWNHNKTLLDSINKTLQQNELLLFYNDFYKKFSPYQKSNKELDLSLVSVMNKVDTLYGYVDRFSLKGKVNPKKVDSLMMFSQRMMTSLVNDFSKYENYISNIKNQYDIKNGRIKSEKDFNAKVDHYLLLLDERHQLIDNSLRLFVQKIDLMVEKRDSLLFAGQLTKKKVKQSFASDLVTLVLKNQPLFLQGKDEFLIKAQASENVTKDIFSDAQNKISGIVQQYQTMYDAENSLVTEKIKNLIITNKNDITVLMFVDLFPQESNVDFHKDIMAALYAVYPNHPIVKDKYNALNSPANRTAIGVAAPELAFENPDGKIMKLSDLRGKYVLIDFWASWCGPCRKENPNVVNLYNKYKDKDFDIYSVSLDKEKNNWIKAIEADKLAWPNHVSDLKFWSSEGAKIYGVSSIPATFLIDKEGKIIAKNLRGAELADKLKSIFGK